MNLHVVATFVLCLVPGLLQGLVGGGGALLYAAIGMGLLSAASHDLLGTALLAASCGACVAALVHGASGTARWVHTRWLLAGALVPALLVPGFVQRIPDTQLMRAAAGVYGLVLVVGVVQRRWGAHWARRRVPLVALGAMSGITTAGFGVAGGSILAQALEDPDDSARSAVATAAVVVAPLTVLSGLGHVMRGQVDWPALIPIGSGAVVGSFLGARLSGIIPPRALSLLTLSTSVLTILFLLIR